MKAKGYIEITGIERTAYAIRKNKKRVKDALGHLRHVRTEMFTTAQQRRINDARNLLESWEANQ